MRNRNISHVFVGVFVVSMLLAAVASLALVTGRTGAVDRYFVTFDNVAGLKFGTQVRYEGFPVGQVEEITPVTDEGPLAFRVAVSVREGWNIPDDSVAAIASASLLAAKTVDIRAGDSATTLTPGDEIDGLPPADLFSTVSAVAGEIGSLNRDSVQPLITQISDVVANLGGSLERDLSELLGTLKSLASTLDERAPVLADQMTTLSSRLNTSAGGLQRVLSDDNVDAVEQAIRSVELASTNIAAMTEDLSRTVSTVDTLVLGVNDMVGENRGAVDQSLEDIQFALRSLTQNLDSILHNLDGTSRNMNEFSRLIRQNPGMLLNGSAREEVSPAAARLE